MPIAALLAKIEWWLKSNRAGYFNQLLPGATDADLDTFAARFGLALPAGFRALYRWRNGQSPNDFSSFTGNRMFMSLAEVTKEKTGLDTRANTDDPSAWRREWIPFLDDGGGNYTVVDLTPEGHGQLRDYYHDEDFRTVVNASVEEWLQEIADSMEDGTYEGD
jgi:cell wall assembly regulator SMI1